MLDHIGIPVSDFDRSKRFYERALAPLGYGLLMEPRRGIAGFGGSVKPDFWVFEGEPGDAVHGRPRRRPPRGGRRPSTSFSWALASVRFRPFAGPL